MRILKVENMVCPFRKWIKKTKTNDTEVITVGFDKCYGAKCPYYEATKFVDVFVCGRCRKEKK